MTILEKFLSEDNTNFSFDDFSISEQYELCKLEATNKNVDEYEEILLSLKIIIRYTADDSISDASEFLLDLDEMNNHFVLLFEYVLTYEKYLKLMEDYNKYKSKVSQGRFKDYISKNIKVYFSQRISALEYNAEENRKTISMDSVKKVISFETISAKREVDNNYGHSKSLSALAYKYYKNNETEAEEFPDLQKQLLDADEKLTGIYGNMFSDVIKEIQDMSYNPREAEISIVSSLIEHPLFRDNTIVKYKHNSTPVKYQMLLTEKKPLDLLSSMLH